MDQPISTEQSRIAELESMLDRCVHYLADLNGSCWIKGDECGPVDMRQRAKGLQSAAFKTLHKGG